jgi:glucan phosphoethanolaminetransferase (alkaline phosphatase superfamily)
MIKEILKDKDVRYAMMAALVFHILFSGSLIAFKNLEIVLQATPWTSIFYFMRGQLVTFLTCFMFFLGSTIHRHVKIAVGLTLFAGGAFVHYYCSNIDVIITPHIVRLFLKNDISESMQLLDIKAIMWTATGVACYFSIDFWAEKSNFRFNNKWKILIIVCCGALSTYFGILQPSKKIILPKVKLLASYQPWQTLQSLYYYVVHDENVIERRQIFDKKLYTMSRNEDVVSVLVIGESARHDHFGILGYERDTTPGLKNIKDVFAFRAESCQSVTFTSIECMLSHKSREEFDIYDNYESALSILRKLGFKTAWLGTQNCIKMLDFINGGFYQEPEILILSQHFGVANYFKHDKDLLPYLKHFLTTKDKRKMIVLHTYGSHWNYSQRYPDEFDYWQPSSKFENRVFDYSPNDIGEDVLVNAYDNSIRYTDDFLKNVIEILKPYNSFMIYVSDHGQSLGEGGVFMHGSSNRAVRSEQFAIPLIFWASKQFYKSHLGLKQRLSELHDMTLDHDYIFHSLLRCNGVKSDIIRDDLSLCP